ncbi:MULTISPECIES: DMT family transporter [Mesorhizobium]|uniref:DMT family transporter n=1 Tax=Mesorhizobium denitrificans TaxID=2294114 RepID=A0A371XDK7_9HYPH|nr:MULTISPECIES: DMT family transporter [Mesorhizobium]RFC67315.1 DMT family transporter [Mesorhizobium denitrificans]
MGGVFWPLLGIVVGGFLAIQAPVNAELSRNLGMPVAAAGISFLVGAVVLGLITLLMVSTQNAPPLNWRAPSLWMFVLGGFLGASFVTCNILLAPRLGAASLMAFLVTGQLVAGLLVDRFGAFGLAVREITMGRIAGAFLLLAGALLIRFA